MVKLIPLAGGIIGGASDGISTASIGKVAKKVFIDTGEDNILFKENA